MAICFTMVQSYYSLRKSDLWPVFAPTTCSTATVLSLQFRTGCSILQSHDCDLKPFFCQFPRGENTYWGIWILLTTMLICLMTAIQIVKSKSDLFTTTDDLQWKFHSQLWWPVRFFFFKKSETFILSEFPFWISFPWYSRILLAYY